MQGDRASQLSEVFTFRRAPRGIGQRTGVAGASYEMSPGPSLCLSRYRAGEQGRQGPGTHASGYLTGVSCDFLKFLVNPHHYIRNFKETKMDFLISRWDLKM